MIRNSDYVAIFGGVLVGLGIGACGALLQFLSAGW